MSTETHIVNSSHARMRMHAAFRMDTGQRALTGVDVEVELAEMDKPPRAHTHTHTHTHTAFQYKHSPSAQTQHMLHLRSHRRWMWRTSWRRWRTRWCCCTRASS